MFLITSILQECHVFRPQPQPIGMTADNSYHFKAAKIKKMSEIARQIVKLLQMFFIRLGCKPDTIIARQIDLPQGLAFRDLIFWLFKAIESAEEKADKVIATEKASLLISKWRAR